MTITQSNQPTTQQPNNKMKSKSCKYWITAVVGFAALALALATQAQTVTNPCPNRVISWNCDNNSTLNPTDLAGLAAATNWVDTYLNNVTASLPDNTGTATTLNLSWSSFNSYSVGGRSEEHTSELQ